MTTVALSSCLFPRQTLAEIDKIAIENNIIVEFSSGFRFEENLPEKFAAAKCRKFIHNYFPPPKVPFVLNLASLQENVWTQSFEHAKQALALAAGSKIPFYTVHAGFCIDPDVEQLGRKMNLGKTVPREKYWAKFIQAIRSLLKECDRLGVDLYIENNVTIKQNLLADGSSPFLCSSTDETDKLMAEINHPRFGLLLDTAHLKVSAHTMGFSKDDFIKKNEKWTKAVHHSDNDGTIDNNKPLDANYWFLPYMPRFAKLPHIIEVNNQSLEDGKKQIALLQNAAQVPA